MPETIFAKKYGPWALVTGAAMGVGAAFARKLAGLGLDLVLVDAQRAALTQTADNIALDFAVQVTPVTVDLSRPDFMDKINPAIEGLEIGLLVNNAGISQIGEFLEVPIEQHLKILDVNARASLVLTHAVAPQMVARGRGGIIFVSSLSAARGAALVGSYAGTKGLLWVFGQSLWDELRFHGVDVLVTPLGTTDTPGWREGNAKLDKNAFVMSPDETAAEVLAALGKTPTFTPGRKNRFSFWLLNLLGVKKAIQTVGDEMRRMYKL
ncbi:MAG: SDR family NAD(P)-dependent oxidoreductase [Chloroflexota bacterium]